MACAALVAAASMSAVLAQAPVEAPSESPVTEGPMSSASAALPALGVVGASLVSVIAFYLQ